MKRLSRPFSRPSRSFSSPSFGSTWASYKAEYRRDPQRIISYRDPQAHKVRGRVFTPDKELLSTADPLFFPTMTGYTLRGEEVKVPPRKEGVVLVGLALKGGFDYVKSWLDPFEEIFKDNKRVEITEICLHEYAFLKYFRSSFIKNLKEEVPEKNYDRTILSFGNNFEIAVNLLLPSQYTGYVYLVDKYSRVRWRGCGETLSTLDEDGNSVKEEVDNLVRCTRELLREK